MEDPPGTNWGCDLSPAYSPLRAGLDFVYGSVPHVRKVGQYNQAHGKQSVDLYGMKIPALSPSQSI